MKNLLQNIYIFSKLSVSFILIFIIILLIYLFYVSYTSISNQENAETKNNKDLVNSINLNSSKIEKIEVLINENNSKLAGIMDLLNSNDQNNESDLILNDIQKDFNDIKLELEKLKNAFQEENISKDNSASISNYNNSDYNNKENTVQLIKFKFENGQSYSEELELLLQLIGTKNTPIIEKLYLINNNRFVGNKTLMLHLKKETDIYIANNFVKRNKIVNIILPYIKIEPSKKKKLSDKRLIALDNIYKQIQNKNYSKSIDLINSIDKETKYFKLTLNQLAIAFDFDSTIGKILDNG